MWIVPSKIVSFTEQRIDCSSVVGCLCTIGIRKFQQMSTDEVYGALGPSGMFNIAILPSSPYSASKAIERWFNLGIEPMVALGTVIQLGPYQHQHDTTHDYKRDL